MQPYNKAVMTDKGVELLNKTQAGQCQIEITRMAIGDGNYLAVEKKEEYLKEQLALKNEKNSYPISNKSVSSDNSIIITAIFSNQDPVTYEALVKEGYCINEIGVFAKERGTTEEILYSIAVAEEIGDYMPAFEGSNQAQIIQSYQITVSNMETAEVVINYTGAAMLASDGQAHIANKDNPHGVTKSQLGLGNVDNTADANKSVKHATTADSATKATQDGNGNVIANTYLTKTGDSQNNTVTFTSADSASPASWTDVSVMTSGEKHSALFNKISTMFKNVRYLYKMLGTTDISKIGGGTVTGSVNSLKELATKLWIIPNNMDIRIFDIGEPDSTKYPPSYPPSDEEEIPQPVGDIYLDVASGKVYKPIEDFEFGIIWYSYNTLKSVSNSILSRVLECTASTTETDIAGASAVAELKNVIGTYKYSNPIITNVKTDRDTLSSRITLEPGVWIVRGEIRWNSNADGIRSMVILPSEMMVEFPLSAYTNSNISIPPALNSFTQSVLAILNVTEETTYYFWVYQNSGVDIITAYGGITAVRLSA